MLFKTSIKKTIITKCHREKFLLSWVSELWIFFLNLTSFAVILILNFFCMFGAGSVPGIPNTDPGPESPWIRIQYGSNTDPNPQHWYVFKNIILVIH